MKQRQREEGRRHSQNKRKDRKERKVRGRKERGDGAQFSCCLQGKIEPVVISANNRPPLSAACMRNAADTDKSHTHFAFSRFDPANCDHVISHTLTFSPCNAAGITLNSLFTLL